MFPCDVIKSRLQVSADAAHVGLRAAPLLARQLYASHGIAVFYKGVAAAVMRAFPANGALFLGYELPRAALTKYT